MGNILGIKPHMGFGAEVAVKKKLWRFNYKVRHMPNGHAFDLLIDDKTRLEVKSSKKYTYSWHFGIGTVRGFLKADAYAFVFNYDDGTRIIRFISLKELQVLKKKRNCKESISFKSPDAPELHKSPYHIFGYPQQAVKPLKQATI